MAYNLPKKKDGIKLDYLPIDWTTKKGRKVVLDEYDVKDEPSLHALFQDTVNVGESYPQDSATLEEFRSYYLTHQVFVVKDSKEGNILGAFYVKPNFPGRSSHICNSGFLVDAICKGQNNSCYQYCSIR
ncbi:DgyrCDS12854 [Dimorphilus gyrociliatus]|uniref:DgyrCDS12854 n=1 Tax=Dimorphilus gyrociliatus TaxID=2664684 RepID=A0A7I8W8Z3_9ANNE|nr:DgyrCDS12854 [Dimorphilus gyrociliatus]